MTTLFSAIIVLALGLQNTPPGAQPNETVNQLSRSASQQLEASVAELNQLREHIAAEKLPLAEELTLAEDRLSQLRREHEKIVRLVDAGNLEITTIRSEIKARQDELSYVTNLLDEYARTFESKINISEMQHVGEAIDSAKQAVENTTLTMPEKFARQTAFIDLTIERLFDAIGGMRFDGEGVDLQGMVADGQFAIIGPVALFRSASGVATGVVVPQSGSTKPLIRPLEGAMQAGIASIVDSGEGLLPLDPSRGGALQALVQRTNLIHIFKKGGPIMWPLLGASVIALFVVLERLLFLFIERLRRNPRAMERFFAAVGHGDIDGAIAIGRKSRFYVVRALGYALAHRDTSLPNALLYAQAQELKRFQRGIPILDTVITLAPLLGLLGTVTGMMGSFSIIGGELSSPGAITGGIAEALIATAFGLGIAITALLPFNFLNARLERARHELESASTQLELLVNPRGNAAAGDAPESPVRLPHTTTETRPVANDAIGGDEQTRLRERLAIQRQIAELQAMLDRRAPALQSAKE